MCGIAGIAGWVADREQLMQRMLQIQHHRGPDAKVHWETDDLILGHNRLSIIDLHASANQPMHSNCGRYTIVFNGEIYNYKELKESLKSDYAFITQSDTEVLLAAYIKWGKNMLEQLNGMFAFCIWDQHNKILFAARDRFGVKPFHYTIHEGAFYFASEI